MATDITSLSVDKARAYSQALHMVADQMFRTGAESISAEDIKILAKRIDANIKIRTNK